MSLQTLFKLVTCWCTLNTVRQVVPRGRACDGECLLAELQTGLRDEQNTVCHLCALTGVQNEDGLKQRERIVMQDGAE